MVRKVLQCDSTNRKVFIAPKIDEVTQRNKLFEFKGIILEKVCDFIIDSGSTKNLISWKLVRELGLQTEPHFRPYRVGWIKNGLETRIERVCKIPVAFGKVYCDVLVYEVIDMDSCHVLLGRPRQYDVDALFRGRANTHEFY